MTEYRLVAGPRVDLDVGAAFTWYENEQAGLGLDFLNELRAAYDRIADGPFKYQDLRSGIRRALVRRFLVCRVLCRRGGRGSRARGAARQSRSSGTAATKGLTTACIRRLPAAADTERLWAMNSLTLRKASPNDNEFAYCARRAAFREYLEKVAGWDEDEQRRLHEQRFKAQEFRVINVAGTDVGILAVVVAPDCVKVNQLFLLPEHQGKGSYFPVRK